MDNNGVCEMFTNYHCACDDCPNIRFERFADMYDDDVARDAGYKRTPCSKCQWHRKPTCADCLFENGEECISLGNHTERTRNERRINQII